MLREIKITPVLNGWIVTVGCQTVVFNDKPNMLNEIDAYLDDPERVEKTYQETAVNARHVFVETRQCVIDETVAMMQNIARGRWDEHLTESTQGK
jgi:hypothetical protein